MTQNKPLRIELTVQQVQALIDRGQQRSFAEQDYPIVVTILRNYFTLDYAHQEKSHTIIRLLNRFFGHRTEKSREVLKNASPEQELPNPSTSPGKDTPGEKPKGHGRNGASAYQGAQKVCVPHGCYQGRPCLSVSRQAYPFGALGVEVRMAVGTPDATVYELEKLRCNLCGKVFTAPVAEEAGKDKYDETAGAMIALFHWGGFPSTAWRSCTRVSGSLFPLPLSGRSWNKQPIRFIRSTTN
jgi:hypothetical protein